MKQEGDAHERTAGFEYIDGHTEMPSAGKALICCGECLGCWHTWLPFCSCFCCCFGDPYIKVPQGSVGLMTEYCFS